MKNTQTLIVKLPRMEVTVQELELMVLPQNLCS